MLSNDLQNMFDDFEARNPEARKQRALHGVFIDIATAITRMRNAAGMSQRKLAHLLHTSHPTIVRWETPGYSSYTLAKLVDLADALEHEVQVNFRPKVASGTVTEENDWQDGSRLDEFSATSKAPSSPKTDYSPSVTGNKSKINAIYV